MKTYVARWLVIHRYPDPDIAPIQSRASGLKFAERGKALHTRGFAVLEPPAPTLGPPTAPDRNKTKLNAIQPIENKEWASLQIATKIHFSKMRYLHSGSSRFGLETGVRPESRHATSSTLQ
jgi:hypothetical protein